MVWIQETLAFQIVQAESSAETNVYIKKKLAQETPDPELFSVTNVPMYDKISSRRILADVPMSLAHHKLESIPEAMTTTTSEMLFGPQHMIDTLFDMMR